MATIFKLLRTSHSKFVSAGAAVAIFAGNANISLCEGGLREPTLLTEQQERHMCDSGRRFGYVPET
jgi:hypothetical protein